MTSGEPTPDGSHDEVRWLSVGACDGVDWLTADRPIVDQLMCDGGFA